MKYRLKDRELQQKLDNLSDGDFSVQLQKIEDIVLDALSGPVVHFGGLARVIDDRFRNLAPRFTFRFHKDELEEIPEYSPSAWNEWPKVEPPRNTLLRVEVLTERIDWDTPEPRGGQSRFKGSGIFDGREWYFYGATTRKEGETILFRPWVGPDEDDKK